MDSPFWAKLFASIANENTYILIFAVLETAAFAAVCVLRKHIEQSGAELGHDDQNYRWLRGLYDFFLTGITIFPLLGMFGTVKALLSLDFTNDLAGAQLKFFDALTSTAWGIIFAVIFKIANSVIAPGVERLIDREERRLRGGRTKGAPR